MCFEFFFPGYKSIKINSHKFKTVRQLEKKTSTIYSQLKVYNVMCSLLFDFRRKSINWFNNNFHFVYGKTSLCKCKEKTFDKQQSLALACEILKSKTDKKLP